MHRPLRAVVLRPIARANARSILDYGAGQSTFIANLNLIGLTIRDRYDPAIPAISTVPREKYDVILCTDVLEHLYEDEIDLVLKHISSLTDKAVLSADANDATTILPNGENAHATVQPIEWWVEKIRTVFPIADFVSADQNRATIQTWRPTTSERIAGDAKYLVARLANWQALRLKRKRAPKE